MGNIINTTNGSRTATLDYVLSTINANNTNHIPIEVHLCISLVNINEIDLPTMAMQSSHFDTNEKKK